MIWDKEILPPDPLWDSRERAYRCPVCFKLLSRLFFAARQHVRECKPKETK